MKEKVLCVFTCVILSLAITACGDLQNTNDNSTEVEKVSEDETGEPTSGLDTDDTMSIEELNAAIAAQSVAVQEEYLDWSNPHYPSIVNNSDTDIKDMYVILTAWDQNDLPVKFIDTDGENDYSEENYPMVYDAGFDDETLDYVYVCSCKDINIPIGGMYDPRKGVNDFYDAYTLVEDTEDLKVKALVLWYKDFDGNEWENPYIEDWINICAGKKFVLPETTIEDVTEQSTSIEELDAAVNAQPVYVQDTKYVNREAARVDSLFPFDFHGDFLSSNVKNNSGTDIKDIYVAYLAWDQSNLPVLISESSYVPMVDDLKVDAGYIGTVAYRNINLPAGGNYEYTLDSADQSVSEFDDVHPYLLPEGANVAKAKSLVYCYVDFDGNGWVNPYYEAWLNAYAGKRLEE